MNFEFILFRLPEIFLTFATAAFTFQLRKMNVDGEKVKRLDQKIINLTAENESLRYQYTQLLAENEKIKGENVTYRKFHEHPVV